MLAKPIPYDEQQIAKLAPATPHKGALVVAAANEGLNIWGMDVVDRKIG
jgi:hypothetical protein